MIEIKNTVMGRTILMPHKIVKVSRKIDVLDEEKNKDLGPTEVQQTKRVSKKLPANFQLATVVATSSKGEQFKVGDVVAFKPNRVVLFELLPKLIIIDDFDIICTVKENSVE